LKPAEPFSRTNHDTSVVSHSNNESIDDRGDDNDNDGGPTGGPSGGPTGPSNGAASGNREKGDDTDVEEEEKVRRLFRQRNSVNYAKEMVTKKDLYREDEFEDESESDFSSGSEDESDEEESLSEEEESQIGAKKRRTSLPVKNHRRVMRSSTQAQPYEISCQQDETNGMAGAVLKFLQDQSLTQGPPNKSGKRRRITRGKAEWKQLVRGLLKRKRRLIKKS
jgi:hypothetical protein